MPDKALKHPPRPSSSSKIQPFSPHSPKEGTRHSAPTRNKRKTGPSGGLGKLRWGWSNFGQWPEFSPGPPSLSALQWQVRSAEASASTEGRRGPRGGLRGGSTSPGAPSVKNETTRNGKNHQSGFMRSWHWKQKYSIPKQWNKMKSQWDRKSL